MIGSYRKFVSVAGTVLLAAAIVSVWNWAVQTSSAEASDGFGLLRADTTYRVYSNTDGCLASPPTIKARIVSFDRNAIHSKASIKRLLGHSLKILSHIPNHPCDDKRYLKIDGTVIFGNTKAAEFKAQLEWLGNAAAREFLTFSSFQVAASPPDTEVTKFLTDWSSGVFMRERTNPPRPAFIDVKRSRADGVSLAGFFVNYADVPRMQRVVADVQPANADEKHHLDYAKFAINFFAKHGEGGAKGPAPGEALRKLATTNEIAALNYYYASDCDRRLKALAKKRPEGSASGAQVSINQYARKCLQNDGYNQFAAFQDIRNTLIASGWAIGGGKLTVTKSAGPSNDAVQKALHNRLVESAKAVDPLYRSMVPSAGGEATVCDQHWCVLRNTIQFRWHVASTPNCKQQGAKSWTCKFNMRQVVRVKSGWMGTFGWGQTETPWQQQMLSKLGRSAEFDATLQMQYVDNRWVNTRGVIIGHRSGQDIRW